MTAPPEITEGHLRRRAVLYLRQSSMRQVRQNRGSTELQRELAQVLQSWGWAPDQIEVFDGDLGTSGSVAGFRGGFQWLLQEGSEERIGIVMVAEDDRLSRNGPDFAQFREMCAVYDVLYAIQRQIINYAQEEGELVGTVLNAATVYQSKILFRKLRNARVRKAKDGAVVAWPPVGYERQGDRLVKDHRPEVREALDLVFRKIFELGSGRALVRYLRRHGHQIPRRRPNGDIKWVDATWSHLGLLFHNETYAGVYGYRKKVVDRRLPRLKNGHHRTRTATVGETIRHENHHEPFLDPARWPALQELLSANKRVRGERGRLGKGPALCQRRLRCTVHGVTLTPTYGRHRQVLPNGQEVRATSYDCVRAFRERAENGYCMRLRGRWVDQAVEWEILRVLTPPRFEVVAGAITEAQEAFETASRHRERECQQREQIAKELERQYLAVADTERFLKQRLCVRSNEAWRNHTELIDQHRRQPLQPPIQLDDARRKQIGALLSDLPNLWHHPAVSFEQRKRLCHRVIRTIHVTPGDLAIRAEIEWASGNRTTIELMTTRGADEIIASGLRENRTSAAIAAELNRAGALRRNRLAPHTAASVRSRARRLGVPAPSLASCELIATGMAAGRTTHEIAAELNARGIFHRLGKWTQVHVLGAIKQMRAGKVPGFETLPPLARKAKTREEIARLWNETDSVEEVARLLNRLGLQSKRKRLWTATAVRHELSVMGLSNGRDRSAQDVTVT